MAHRAPGKLGFMGLPAGRRVAILTAPSCEFSLRSDALPGPDESCHYFITYLFWAAAPQKARETCFAPSIRLKQPASHRGAPESITPARCEFLEVTVGRAGTKSDLPLLGSLALRASTLPASLPRGLPSPPDE